MSRIITLIFVLISFTCYLQDSTWNKSPTVKLDGFLDVFYVYDFNTPSGNQRQPFMYNHNRHNEFNINLGLMKVAVSHPKYRMNFAMHTGTYANDNYAQEPGLLKNIFEGNVGISLNKKNNLWIDAGVLPSYIGFESAISSSNFTLTRSLLAENSPYFFTGAQITYSPTKKLKLAGLVLNGWQRIEKQNSNSLPAFGTQVNYTHSKNLVLNWSTFVGSEFPDSARRMRYFNNFFAKIQLAPRVKVIAGFDIGIEQKSQYSSVYHTWYSPALLVQVELSKSWKMGLRAEYYQDANDIALNTGSGIGFHTLGGSINLDYQPAKNILWRIETRWLNSKEKYFVRENSLVRDNFFIGTSLAVKFSEIIKK